MMIGGCYPLTKHKLHSASAPLLHQNLLSLDEVILQAVLVMANGEQLQAVVVLDAETVFEFGSQLFQLLLVAVEAERKHQGGGLDHVGVDVEVGADGKDGLEVALVHERIVAGRDGDQRLVVLDDKRGDALVVFTMATVDERGLVVGVEERLHLQRDSLVLQRLDGLWVDDGGAIEG